MNDARIILQQKLKQNIKFTTFQKMDSLSSTNFFPSESDVVDELCTAMSPDVLDKLSRNLNPDMVADLLAQPCA